MEEYILVNGAIISYMGKDNSIGPMVENTLVNLSMISKVAMEFTNGQMENNMKECGLTDNNTEMVFLQMQKEKAARVLGNMANESSGWVV